MKPWAPIEVADRVERARGALLARTGREVKWSDIGRLLRWTSSATASEAKAGRRPLRVAELGDIAQLLECSPGWLAFAEGQMWGGRDGGFHIEPGVTSATTGVDAATATAREIAEEEAARRRPAAGEGPVRPATGAPGTPSGRGAPAKRRRGR